MSFNRYFFGNIIINFIKNNTAPVGHELMQN